MTSTPLAQNLWAASELLVGFGIVMATLVLLWGLTALMARIVAALQQRPSAATPAAAAAVAVAANDTDAGPGDEEIAVVAAAVAVMLARPHRIVRVRPQPPAWGEQGRRDAHSSHRWN